jgi:hypothetical protein
MMTLEHQPKRDHRSGLQDWLLSRTGVATCVALAVLGYLIYAGHSAHLLGALPFLLILSCPLMHFFMHHGHHHNHDHSASKQESDKKVIDGS